MFEKPYSSLQLYQLYCGAGRRGVLHTPYKIKFVRKGRNQSPLLCFASIPTAKHFVGQNKTTQAQRVAAFPVYEPCRCRKRFLANARKALFQPTIKFTYFLTLSTERLVGSYQIPKK